MSNEVTDFLNQSSGELHDGFKFANIGDTCKGTISELPKVVEFTSKFTNQQERQLVIPVTDDTGATHAVWVKAGFAASAVQDALTEANAPGLEVGGKFAMQLVELRDTGKGNPAKVYKAQYQPPAAPAVGVDSLLS